MYEWKNPGRLPAYAVSLGHTRVIVHSASPAEAVAEARRLMCADMPRMWDVIGALEADRFQVALLSDDR
jgi:hypothetical protein